MMETEYGGLPRPDQTTMFTTLPRGRMRPGCDADACVAGATAFCCGAAGATCVEDAGAFTF